MIDKEEMKKMVHDAVGSYFSSPGKLHHEIERLRAENARLYALLVEAQDYIDDIYLYIAISKELEGHDLRAAAAAIRESGDE
jgi:hypothetical protein